MAVGLEFSAAGTLNQPQDLAFLKISELSQLAHSNVPVDSTVPDWKTRVAERRAVYARELRRRQVPSVLVSDGRTFYEGSGAARTAGAALSGSPVSPGVVEGRVRVVLDPRSTPLAPGEILVCPGTDPAWTPLFMAAGGLITEVGGMMTHGSVVAREYGIPAVVGVQHATQILHDGQRIRLNGATGEITLLADDGSEPEQEGLPAAPMHV
jgi:pyruvate,water dikinase